MYKNEHMDIPCAEAPCTPNRLGTPSNTKRREKSPYEIPISLKPTDTQGSQQLSGGATEGEAPPYGEGVREVSHMEGGPLQPHNMPKPLRTYRCTEECGEHIGGVYTLGV